MKKIYAGVSAVAVLLVIALTMAVIPPPAAHAVGPTQTSYFITAPAGSDPCENPSVTKFSAPIAITSATTTNLLSAVSGDYITVCKWQFTVVGTSPTIQFEYGTTASTACDTGATALTGAMAIPTTTIFISIGAENMSLRTPISQQLCLVTGGTITGVEGYFTYTQQPY
jgi:hypothetical protein